MSFATKIQSFIDQPDTQLEAIEEEDKENSSTVDTESQKSLSTTQVNNTSEMV